MIFVLRSRVNPSYEFDNLFEKQVREGSEFGSARWSGNVVDAQSIDRSVTYPGTYVDET